jgi:hypothetical protein
MQMSDNSGEARAFKTAWFAKAAQKARISDQELRQAFNEARKGQADDLGGGVFKKRLNKNRHRSIVLAKGRRFWVYTYLFAKKDRANIEEDELKTFRRLAELYANKTADDIEEELLSMALVEICHDS